MALDVGTPFQIAWVVRDLDGAEAALSSMLGAKKWVRMPEMRLESSQCTYRGKPTSLAATASFSYVGDVQLEIIMPGAGDDNLYEEFLRESGPGLHHTCIEVDDIHEAMKKAEAQGIEVMQWGTIPGAGDFAYVAAPGATGPSCVELIRLAPEIRQFFDYVISEQR